MVLFQALLAFMQRSLGKILQALFGWAVLAVFGRVRDEEKTLFSVAIGAAAAWPILLLGIVWPRPVAIVLTLLPIPRGTPEGVIRAIWIFLAAAIPLLVGVVVGRRAGRPLPLARQLAMGFPITAALATAFLVVCVSVPIGKLVAFVRNRKQRQVVLVSPPGTYRQVARDVREALAAGGLETARAKPPWHLTALARILRRLGGGGLSAYAPEELAYFRGPEVRLAIYPGGVNIWGRERAVARAQALIAERAPQSEGLQTTSEEAQKIEREIRAIWKDAESGRLDRKNPQRLRALFAAVAELDAEYEEWETVYRQSLQVALAASGGEELLARAVRVERSASRKARSRFGRSARAYARRRTLDSAQSGLSNFAGKLVARLLFGRRR